MTTQQLLALFPGSAEDKEIKAALEGANAPGADETAYVGFDPANYSTKERFAHIGSVGVALHKGRAVSFTVAYLGATWRSVDEWVAKLSEGFGLPGSREWAIGPSETPNKVLRCNGFEIEAAVQGGSASIGVRNEGLMKEAAERARAEEEKKRREFKPR